MTTYAPGVPPQNRNPQSIGFLLLDNFTLISLASAVEPLRMANQLSGRELYRWHTLSLDGRQVWASDGLQITPDAGTDNAPAVDCVIVCGGVGIQRSVTREHVTFLQAQAISAWRGPGSPWSAPRYRPGNRCSDGRRCRGSWRILPIPTVVATIACVSRSARCTTPACWTACSASRSCSRWRWSAWRSTA